MVAPSEERVEITIIVEIGPGDGGFAAVLCHAGPRGDVGKGQAAEGAAGQRGLV